MLLTRIEFKEQVFKRDNHKCIICNKDAADAHHIIDRSLFSDNGYYLDNGVSLCSECHIKAEQTIISCKELRTKANIQNIIYPPYLSLNEFVFDYDKWGNPILKNNKRLQGYIFKEENVQKIIKPILHLFEKDNRIIDKYPRTYHFPFSKGTTSDDRISKNINMILSNDIVISEKLDGGNMSLSEFGVFARSRIEPSQHKWDKWISQKYNSIKNDLKDFDIEFCGENMFAEHSIIYSNLTEYFYVFGIRNTKHDVFLSWEEVEYYSELFNFKTVPILFKGKTKDMTKLEKFVNSMMNESSILSDGNIWNTPKEGIVCRIQDNFPNDMFFNSVLKYVRHKHVKTDKHWSKNWKKAKLHSELINYDQTKLKQLYKTQIETGLMSI